jgi:hypothetical protein
VESPIPHVVQKGGSGVVPLCDHIIGQTAAPVADGPAEESPTRAVLTVPRTIGLDIQGQRQAGALVTHPKSASRKAFADLRSGCGPAVSDSTEGAAKEGKICRP